MTREIKFRVWDIPGNLYWGKGEGMDIKKIAFNFYDQLFVDDTFVFQQYTGVNDKNNKEIYEGDLMVFDKDGHREYRYTVVFSHGKFELKMPNAKMNIDIEWRHEMVKVGNIFENKDLICIEKKIGINQ